MLLTRHAGRLENRTAPRTFVAATVVCLVLLALLAVVQVAHVHPLETDAGRGCGGDHHPGAGGNRGARH